MTKRLLWEGRSAGLASLLEMATPLAEANVTFRGTLMGTPEFMSPEQAERLAA